MSEATSDPRRPTIWALLVLVLLLAVWLWPIGIGGTMPVGGDVTQFSMGLMVVLHNLPMVAGVAPISASRTLDLPALVSLTHLAQKPLGRPEMDHLILAALRATGAGVRVFDPFESRLIARGDRDPPGWGKLKTIRARPWLAGSMAPPGWPARAPGPRRSSSETSASLRPEPGWSP